VHEATVKLNDERWGVGPESPVPEGASEILELDEYDDD
jgi:hypothetical protein